MIGIFKDEIASLRSQRLDLGFFRRLLIKNGRVYSPDDLGLAPGKHADLIILKEPFELDGVLWKGKWARKNGQTLIHDLF